MSKPSGPGEIVIRPANEVPWADLEAVFGTRGASATCRCQRYKLERGESFGRQPVEERAERLRDQTNAGHAGEDRTSGLVAYLDGEPTGWCAVEPRTAYGGLVRNQQVPWSGRDEDRADPTVWAITCLLTRTGYRRRGVSRALASAAVERARTQGARAVEAYPILTSDCLSEERHPGLPSVYAAAGLELVDQPTVRRAVLRLDF